MKRKFNRELKAMLVFVIAIISILTINPQQGQAKGDIKIIIDGKEIITDTSPIIVNSRTLVPFSVIFENLGSTDVEWLASTREVKASIGDTQVKLKIDDKRAYINNILTNLDVPATIRNKRTLVPVRFIAESTGENKVIWDNNKREVHITTPNNKIVGEQTNTLIKNKSLNKSFSLGESVQSIIDKFGQANRKDPSEQGYTWYIYNNDLADYFQVGIKDDQVVAFATNSLNWEYDGFKVGSKDSRLKGNINDDRFKKNGYTTSILVDNHKDKIISTIYVSYIDIFSKHLEYNDQVNQGIAMQLHDLVNVYRHRNGVKALKRDDKLVKLAEYHSKDMASNQWFNHNSYNGDSLWERAEKITGSKRGFSENIAAGHENALFSADSLYNSLGHRENILDENNLYSGTGVQHGGEIKGQNLKRTMAYYTHVFQTEKFSKIENPYGIEWREVDEFVPWDEWN